MSTSRFHPFVVLAGMWAVASIAVLAGQTLSQTPARPDFRGKWALRDAREGPWGPFGSRFTATQTKDALTLEMVTLVTFDAGGPATLAKAEPVVSRVIRFNVEERETYAPPPDDLFASLAFPIASPLSSVTRTGWQGEYLVITTHTVSRMTAFRQTPSVFETQDLDQLAVSLIGPNQLSVERLRIEDPLPWGQDHYLPPSTSTTFYWREGTDSTASADGAGEKQAGAARPPLLQRPADQTEPPAVVALRARAVGGDSNAQVALAERYGSGNGVPRDNSQAASWYRKAADQGNASAQKALGLFYDNGLGVETDSTQATLWYRKAADQGLVSAQLELGLRYERGKGVPQDFKQAASWFRKAADLGDALAQYYLATQYTYSGPQYIGPDYAQAASWYRKAAEQGQEHAMRSLAQMYDEGQGVPKDGVEALRWQIIADKFSLFGSQASSEREQMAKSMTPQQLAEAQKRADQWLVEFQKRAKK